MGIKHFQKYSFQTLTVKNDELKGKTKIIKIHFFNNRKMGISRLIFQAQQRYSDIIFEAGYQTSRAYYFTIKIWPNALARYLCTYYRCLHRVYRSYYIHFKIAFNSHWYLGLLGSSFRRIRQKYQIPRVHHTKICKRPFIILIRRHIVLQYVIMYIRVGISV